MKRYLSMLRTVAVLVILPALTVGWVLHRWGASRPRVDRAAAYMSFEAMCNSAYAGFGSPSIARSARAISSSSSATSSSRSPRKLS